jgi:hypothetical protein
MGNDTIVELRKPEEVKDELTELLHSRARHLIAEAGIRPFFRRTSTGLLARRSRSAVSLPVTELGRP